MKATIGETQDRDLEHKLIQLKNRINKQKP